MQHRGGVNWCALVIATACTAEATDDETTEAAATSECFPAGIPVEPSVSYVKVSPSHTFANPQINGGFAQAEGGHPRSGLLFASDGRLYGATETHGANMVAGCSLDDDNCPGTVYSLTRTGTDFRVIHSFQRRGANNETGYQSTASLVEAPDGNIYGTTIAGGAFDGGVIFKFPLANPTVTAAVPFPLNGSQVGRNAYGGLVHDGASNFYGVTHNGGKGTGVIYKFDGMALSRVAAFDAFEPTPTSNCPANLGRRYQNATGAAPFGSLVLGPDARLRGIAPYGGTQRCVLGATLPNTARDACTGCGGAFTVGLDQGRRFTPFTPEYTFRGNYDAPHLGGLILGADGNYYGTSQFGGSSGNGIVFRMTPAGAIIVLHEFPSYLSASACGPGKTYCNRGTAANAEDRGGQPMGALVEGVSDPYLYGTTYYGGANGTGTIFQMTKDGTKFITLYDFSERTLVKACKGANREGTHPVAHLTPAASEMFGTTRAGGGADRADGYRGFGTVFKMRMPLNFDDITGATPNTDYDSEVIKISIISTNTISITNGLYSLNGGPYTNAPGVVSQGDTLQIRVHSASTCNARVLGTVLIDSRNTSYGVTTGC